MFYQNGIFQRIRWVIFCAALCLGISGTGHGQWRQWRGPARDGSVPAAARAGVWSVQPFLLWEREVGSGYSAPLVSDSRVWVQSREGGREVVRCLNRDSGEPVWQSGYEVPFRVDTDAREHGAGPFSTPALAEDRLFTVSMTGVLTVWEASTGRLLWRADYGGEFPPGYPYFGASASPLVWEGNCYLHFGSSGGDDPAKGAMIALAVADGREVWRWEGDGPAVGASPVLGMVGNLPQLIFKTSVYLVGVNPHNGKELWRIPYEVPMTNTIVTPLLLEDVLVTSDYEIGFRAWQIQRRGANWSLQERWRQRKASLFTSSPVRTGDIIVGFSHFRKGELVALDPIDGRLLWRGEPRQGAHTTLISWGDTLLVFREDGVLEVGQVSEQGFKVLATHPLGAALMWAHPAIAGGRLYIRDGGRLAAFRLQQGADQNPPQ